MTRSDLRLKYTVLPVNEHTKDSDILLKILVRKVDRMYGVIADLRKHDEYRFLADTIQQILEKD